MKFKGKIIILDYFIFSYEVDESKYCLLIMNSNLGNK